VNVEQYLESKGFDVGHSGDNLMVNCPFCGEDKQRLGVHGETGKWRCLNGGCDARGRSIRSLQKKLNDESITEIKLSPKKEKVEAKIDQSIAEVYHQRLDKKDREALQYLKEVRGFSRDTIDHFQLGSWKKNGYEFVSIPFWEAGKLVNVKYRALRFTEKKYKWRRVKNGRSSLFHDEILDNKEHSKIYICEAELDAISLYNAGIKNVVSVTTGAKSFISAWYDRLERFKRIYLVYDSDVDGQDGAEKIAKRLGMDRCYNVVLPKEQKDVNNFFWDSEKQKELNTLKDFKKLVKEAKKFEAKNCISVSDALSGLSKIIFTADEDEIYGFDTPWPKVNKLIGGVKPGYLVVLSAPPKVGKTSLALNWSSYLAGEGIPSFLYCCEMKPERMSEKLVAMACKDFDGSSNITQAQISKTNFDLADNFYLGHPQVNIRRSKDGDDESTYGLNLESICDSISAAVQRHGIRFVVFDHLHFLVRGYDEQSEIGKVTRTFKLLAEALGIVFLLIVQPKKINSGRIISTDDFKGSSSIYQDCDLAIIIHRDKEEVKVKDKERFSDKVSHYDPLTTIAVSGRWCEGGRTTMFFDGQRSLFFDSGEKYRDSIKKMKYKKGKKQ